MKQKHIYLITLILGVFFLASAFYVQLLPTKNSDSVFETTPEDLAVFGSYFKARVTQVLDEEFTEGDSHVSPSLSQTLRVILLEGGEKDKEIEVTNDITSDIKNQSLKKATLS